MVFKAYRTINDKEKCIIKDRLKSILIEKLEEYVRKETGISKSTEHMRRSEERIDSTSVYILICITVLSNANNTKIADEVFRTDLWGVNYFVHKNGEDYYKYRFSIEKSKNEKAFTRWQ